MRRKMFYKWWQIVLFGGMCSASICSVSFNGSFIDSLVSFPLGCLLILIQLFAARNELYSNVFECAPSRFTLGRPGAHKFSRITVATIFSFISAALSSASFFCYSAIASSSVVLILPVSASSTLSISPRLKRARLSGLHRLVRQFGTIVAQHRLRRRARLLRMCIFTVPRVRARHRRDGLFQDDGSQSCWFRRPVLRHQP